MKEKIIWVVAIIALVIAVIGFFRSPAVQYLPQSEQDVAQKFGAAGGMLAEQYIPYVRYNGGYKTELSLAVGSTTAKDIGAIVAGKCNLVTSANAGLAAAGAANSIMEASTTRIHICSAPGIRVGDIIWVTLPSGVDGVSSSSPLAGPKLYGALMMTGAYATTSDVIGVAITNWTGVATGSYAQATTGVMYLGFR